MVTIGENIRKLREARDMKQPELAALLSKHAVAISHWENGKHNPDLISINKMLEIFNVDANTLFGWEAVEKQAYRENGLLMLFRDLSEEGQDRAIEYIETLIMSGRYKKGLSDSIGGEKPAISNSEV